MEDWMFEAHDPEEAERQRAIHAVAVAQTDYLSKARFARSWGWLPWFGKRLHKDWEESRVFLARAAASASLIVGELQLEGIDGADLVLIKEEFDSEIHRSTPDSDQFPEFIGDESH